MKKIRIKILLLIVGFAVVATSLLPVFYSVNKSVKAAESTNVNLYFAEPSDMSYDFNFFPSLHPPIDWQFNGQSYEIEDVTFDLLNNESAYFYLDVNLKFYSDDVLNKDINERIKMVYSFSTRTVQDKIQFTSFDENLFCFVNITFLNSSELEIRCSLKAPIEETLIYSAGVLGTCFFADFVNSNIIPDVNRCVYSIRYDNVELSGDTLYSLSIRNVENTLNFDIESVIDSLYVEPIILNGTGLNANGENTTGNNVHLYKADFDSYNASSDYKTIGASDVAGKWYFNDKEYTGSEISEGFLYQVGTYFYIDVKCNLYNNSILVKNINRKIKMQYVSTSDGNAVFYPTDSNFFFTIVLDFAPLSNSVFLNTSLTRVNSFYAQFNNVGALNVNKFDLFMYYAEVPILRKNIADISQSLPITGTLTSSTVSISNYVDLLHRYNDNDVFSLGVDSGMNVDDGDHLEDYTPPADEGKLDINNLSFFDKIGVWFIDKAFGIADFFTNDSMADLIDSSWFPKLSLGGEENNSILEYIVIGFVIVIVIIVFFKILSILK